MTSILVVEDEAEVGAELAELLEDLGYRVLGVARTGEQALAMAGEARADVVLMDVKLPGALDGIATAKELARRFHLPVIFLTGHADPSTLARSKEAAAFGFS